MRMHLVVTALACASISAHAASFDCRAAQRPVEKTICSNPTLNAADETMGRLYRDALAKLSGDSIGMMRADQVQWLAWMQQMCPASTGTKPPMANCMLPLYQERIKLLHTAVVRQNGITFFTRSQYFAVPDDRAEFKNYGQYPGMGTLEAQWPRADSADPLWQAWNHQVEIRALLMAGTGEDDSAKESPLRPPVWSSSLAVQRNTDVTALLKRMEHNRVTTALTAETMERPGAHPSDSFESNTWLLAEKRPLEVQDVFASGDKWKTIVSAIAYRSLIKGDSKQYLFPEINGPEAKPLQDVLSDVHNWTLEQDGLHISYPEYSVAPRVARPDDAVIPWTVLASVLATGFVRP